MPKHRGINPGTDAEITSSFENYLRINKNIDCWTKRISPLLFLDFDNDNNHDNVTKGGNNNKYQTKRCPRSHFT